MRYVVVDPGFLPTTRQMALAVADRIESYVTSFALRPGRVAALSGELARRRVPEPLAPRLRRAAAVEELTRVLLARSGVASANYRLLWRRNRVVDERAAALLEGRATVIGQYGGSLASFRRAAVRVLDYPVARLDGLQRTLAEEAELRPDFADTIVDRSTLFHDAAQLRRMEEEVELADAVVVGSRYAADSFAGVNDPARVHVIPYGTDTSAFRPDDRRRRSGPLRVLFAGALTQRKGLAYLLDAMQLLDPVRFELVLAGPQVGSGDGLRAYEGAFRRAGAVAPADMPRVFREADVLVLPSLAEGSALVVLEAMASGLPVVVTPNTGADAMRDGVEGFEVPIRDPAAIAAALERLENADVRARMGAAARERSLAFTWEAFRAGFRSLVDRLEGEAGAR